MATRQRRLEIVIAWMQQHPGVVRNVQTQLRSLAGSYGFLRRNVGQLNLTQAEQATFMEQLTTAYQQMRVAAGARTATTVKLLNKALQGTTKAIQEGTAAGGGIAGAFRRMGFRVGWLGFRLAILGRMILRMAIQPIKGLHKTILDWETGIENAALALALQAAGMGEAGMSAEELRATMLAIPEAAFAVKTAMLGLQTTWMQLAVDNAPALIAILSTLQDILEGTGGVIITSMIAALSDVLPLVSGFLNLLKPLAPLLGTISAALLLLSPFLIGIGMAMFMLQPIMLLVNSGILASTIAIGGMTIALGPLLLAIAAISAALLILYTYWDDIARAFQGAGRWLGNVFGGMPAGARPTGRAGWEGETQQEITIYSSYDIGSVTGEVDLDEIERASNRGTTDALRRRGWP